MKSFCSGGNELAFRKVGPGSVVQEYKGLVLPWIPLNSELGISNGLNPSETNSLIAKGSTAISRCIPTNPVSGLSNFLGELKRDGIPSLPGAETFRGLKSGQPLKGSASDYLNYEFALKPVYSDVQSFATVVRDYDKILKQYIRDSGKNIRRQYRFPVEQTVSNSIVSSSYYPQGGNLPSSWFNAGVLHKQVVTTTEAWFSGAFTYYLELDDTTLGRLKLYEQLANKLLGVRLSPELLWNLTPWTWAADWVSNFGDVFSNVSRFSQDGLVMRYGYVMEQKTITTSYTLLGYSVKSGVTGQCPPLTMTITRQRKARMRASPYGFGVSAGSLSPRQIAILAALGISRGAGIAQ